MISPHDIVLSVTWQKESQQQNKDEQDRDDDHIRAHIHCSKVRFVASVHNFRLQQVLHVLWEGNKLAIDELIFNDVKLGDLNQLSKDLL